MFKSFTTKSQDGTEWYVQQRGSGPDLVLIPSGEGDCSAYGKVAQILSESFLVTTFDMPGFSRSIAGPTIIKNLKTSFDLSQQITGVLDVLQIESAYFYGCSSGAAAVVGLVANNPSRVLNATIHEIPLGQIEGIDDLSQLEDAAIVQACKKLFESMVGDEPDELEAWEALGPGYHARLRKNAVTWVRQYVGKMQNRLFSDEEWKRKPIIWTIGSKNPAGMFFSNVTTAVRVGIPISLLPCRHLPHVTIPERLAEHIRKSALNESV